MLLGYVLLPEGGDVQATLAQYTCPNDGYVHAWQDEANPRLIYLLPECPADAVETILKTAITQFVRVRYGYSTEIKDPHARVLDIERNAREDARKWLEEHTYPELATYLSDASRLHSSIFTELLAQGIVT